MKSIVKLVIPLILLGALAGALWLVKRNQETRRGAAIADTSSSMLPSTISVNAGSTFVVNLWVNTGSTGDSLDASELVVTFDPSKVSYTTIEPLSGYSLARDVEAVSGGAGGIQISLLSTGTVKSGAINIAKLTFKSLTGSSQIKAEGKLMISGKTAMWDIATNNPTNVVSTGTATCVPKPACVNGIKDSQGNVTYCDPPTGINFCPDKPCSSDSDCTAQEFCYQPPMPVCKEGMGCIQSMPARVCRAREEGRCNTDAECPTNFVCSPVPPGGCPNGSACAVPPRCWRKPAKAGEMCGGIAGIKCDTGLTCDYGGRQSQPDASGTCVVNTTTKCGWCGLGCVDWSVTTNQDKVCPMIAPPGNKVCILEGGACVTKDLPERCSVDTDCPKNYICSATPLGGCPAAGVGASGISGSSQCATVPQCIYKYAKEGQMCGGIRGIMCDSGLQCDYGANEGKPDASGTCVKTTEKCMWCGSSCTRHNPLMGCPDSLPPAGQVCVEENNVCVAKPEIPQSEAFKFKTTFAGVTSGAACANNWKGQVVAMWGNAVKKVFDNVDLIKTDETINGLAVFKGEVSMKDVGAKNKLAVFIKGPESLQTKYGKDGQGEFYNKSGGEIDWVAGKVFDFTKYPNLAGDVTGPDGNRDGVVDGIDFAYVKGEVSKRSEGDGMKADLNGNCKLESLDLTLLMLAMKDKQEQMY